MVAEGFDKFNRLGTWIGSASKVGDVTRQSVGVGAVDLREVRVANVDEVRPEPADGVLADVGDALRRGRAEEAADVEEVDVDDDGRDSNVAHFHRPDLGERGQADQFDEDDDQDGEAEAVDVEHRVGDSRILNVDKSLQLVSQKITHQYRISIASLGFGGQLLGKSSVEFKSY